MLVARYKQLAAQPDGRVYARVLCGYPTCGEVLVRVVDFRGSDQPATLVFDGAYVQREPGVWVLGRHAAKKFGGIPRRLRHTWMPTSGTVIARREDGVREARHAGQTQELKLMLGWHDRRPLALQGSQLESLARSKPLSFSCKVHGHHSVVRFEDLERAASTARPWKTTT